MKPSNIHTLVFLVTGFPPDVSGVSLFNWERAQWFAKQEQYRVVVFAPDWQQPSESLSIPPDLRHKLIIERYPSKPWIPYPPTHVPRFKAARYIKQRLGNYNPALIVVTDVERYFLLSTWQLPGRGYAKANQIPYVAEYHTDLYNFSASYPGWQWLRQAARSSQMASYLYRQFDVTVCASLAASQSCQELGIPSVQTIPFLGIDVSTYSPARRNRQWLKPWLSEQEQHNKVLLFLGRLGFEKRVDLLIQAFAKLQEKEPNCSLIIAGDGPDTVVNALKRLAKPISNIHFTGFLLGETKANVLASCDVFCSPSPYETFGRTVVEAMASGLPIVTVNSGAVSEYISNRVNGYLVPPDDAEGLANGIGNVLLSNSTGVVEQALKDAKQFSLDQGCENLSRYYQQLLGIKQDDKDLTSLSRL
ncbi:glycosyltransferase [Pseudanabaena sp. FACHB-2040]|uniref:glycosyltransferase n=1 Tax=Pseudanabaena sp. FACHB-2040 TaxID=2692859 RepID=UPI0016898D55|nr:glycosyltransferase [Pseudanabaena sp. FACHB-2040]MBD2256616.1 glycosyltransferase [Pseudanabaena sp. FACHB-2040]